MKITWGATTHTGLVRRRNEDAVVAEPPLFAVADGMGGHADGNVASTLATETLRQLAREGPVSRSAVLGAIRAADGAISKIAHGGDAAPGTTLCGLALIGWPGSNPTAMVFNVGDSRCYRFRAGRLVQLTHDHSVVQELLDAGTITESEAPRHPERNVITRSLGAGSAVDIDWWLTDVAPGDRYLLCSDGLFREVSAESMAVALAEEATAGDAGDRLLGAALDAGAHDNVSIVIVEVLSTEPHDEALAGEHNGIDDDTEPRSGAVGPDTSSPIAHVQLPSADG